MQKIETYDNKKINQIVRVTQIFTELFYLFLAT